ncbi:hypothetical protein ITP53_36415 [Nonomuraea sp. K274]|uniref:Uncharacterized protein n=1 Tax=Nonomuraea cypriaca TaxID=1187855 RepID=A0A931ADY7_9ACTN|nr:hypothetical protein [Nonomuraea cypriaca]MBF8191101.1 hypothetical protein [Nonomuraea cypriaca]
MTVQDLREALRDQAEAPSPANPHRHDQVRARIRGTRLRRRAAAGMVTGMAAVAAIAVGVSLFPGTTGPVPRETTTAAAGPVSKLPESFTAQDGTEYRRLATAELRDTGEKAVSVTVPLSGRPLDMAAPCDGEFVTAMPDVTVNGKRATAPSFGCADGMYLRSLTVPPGATEVTVKFDATEYGCLRTKKDGPCLPDKFPPGGWDLAVYEWTPPAEPVEPAQVKAFPDRLGGMELATSASGVWPQDSSFTMTAEGTGGQIGVEQLCTGDLATRMWFTFRVGDKELPQTSGCGVWEEGPFPMAMSEVTVPKGERVTVTGRLGGWGEFTNRPVRWSVGVYAR